MEVVSCCCSDSEKQEGLKLLHLDASNRPNRGAIRPYNSQSISGVRKDYTNHKVYLSPKYGLNTIDENLTKNHIK